MAKGIVGFIIGEGIGEGLEPLTPSVDKPLIRLLGKPLIYYPVANLVELGVREFYVASGNPGKLTNVLGQFFNEASFEGLRYPGGFERALRSIGDLPRENTIIVSLGDAILPRRAYEVALSSHIESGKPITILVTPLSDLNGYVGVEVGEMVHIGRVAEHRPGYAWAGILIADSDSLKMLREYGDLNMVFKGLGNNVNVAYWSGWFTHIIYPWDLLAAVKNLLSTVNEARISSGAEVSPRAVIEGPVIIDDEAVIDHGAIIRGPSYIGKGAYVGNNALVRNYTSLEEGSIVGADAEVTGSLVGFKATIGRGSFIGDSVIGDEAVIEPGVVTLNVLPGGVELTHMTPIIIKGKAMSKLGAVIGPRARIGANTVIYPGAMVEAGRYVQPLTLLKSGGT